MRVSQCLIIVPVLVQVLLTLVLFAPNWRERLSGKGEGRFADVYRAQFELPVLFYAAALFAYAMRLVDAGILFLALLFVLSQIVEVVSALAIENSSARSAAAWVAALAVLGMWAKIAAHFAFAGF